MHFAHTNDSGDRGDWQELRLHLHSVAKLAAMRAGYFGCERLGYVAGLFHDLGKYSAAFQRRLAGSDESVDHSTAGADMVLRLTNGKDRELAGLLAYAIAGHHAGLPDMKNDQRSCLRERLAGFKGEIDPAWKSELTDDVSGLMPAISLDKGDRVKLAFQLSFLCRMVFSCLVDADYRDTEDYYLGLKKRNSGRVKMELQSCLVGFSEALSLYLKSLKRDGMVNDIRASIMAHVRCCAQEKPGLFTLTVPTGGGKTLASLAFALDHAKAHGHRRIIYAIPYTSIIDQTAAIFKKILGDDHVLEHHSAIDEEKFKSTENERHAVKLVMEDWSDPVIVTTNVQLFESLFAARPSRCRKLHNIAGSVIILDEAQTLPRYLLSPSMRALDELALNYGCSIVLCTATQPALDKRNFEEKDHPAGLALEGRELAPDPVGLAGKLRRVTFHKAGAMTNSDLVGALSETEQGLVIVNSRRHALALYRDAKQAGLSGLVHLTTRQCAVHRRQILARVREDLTSGQPCRLIATSLVEAGVDLDFPRVWRAESGLDQIAQAAGRCNREGKRPVADSIVTIFNASEFAPPPELKRLASDMWRVAVKHDDLLSLAAMDDYFGEVYWRLGLAGLDGKGILDLLNVSSAGTDFAYRTIAERFQMIESNMVPVIVQWDENAQALVRKMGFEDISSGRLARDLQVYTVQVSVKDRDKMIANGHVSFAAPNLRADQFAVLGEKSGLYHKDAGLIWEEADYLSTTSLVN